MIKLMLNLHKPNNYAFFCPVSRVHLTVSSPVGFANEVTPAILRAVAANTVIDVDGVIDVEKGALKHAEKPANSPKTVAEEAPKQEEVVEAKAEETAAETVVETPKTEDTAETKPKRKKN